MRGLSRLEKVALIAVCLLGVSAEIPRPYDPDGQVKLFQGILNIKPERYRAHLLESFEGERLYEPRAATNQLSDIRFLEVPPKLPAFDAEIELLKTRNIDASSSKVLFLNFGFQFPGRDHFWLRPAQPVGIAGQPFKISLWVHSKRYLHTLTLLFENSNGKEIRLSAGRLDWDGWRRIDLQAPANLTERGRRLERRYSSKFTGFLIDSSPLEESGPVCIMIDNLIAISDMTDLMFPGSEIPDSWTYDRRVQIRK
ncbi:MAG: flagellar filament outer layer protein FlaA [Spirochaetia bacterium]|nr:flagellar filament outer layer protein FlaA [Spirochaetia bacterium]